MESSNTGRVEWDDCRGGASLKPTVFAAGKAEVGATEADRSTTVPLCTAGLAGSEGARSMRSVLWVG